MESFRIENFTFTYPTRTASALFDVSIAINNGEFITIFGKSGCGKSTLLRHLKPVLAPHGMKLGTILFEGQPITEEQTLSSVGYVMQNPDNQIVCDKVWHELAFGLESMGVKSDEIRVRVAEMASFFGIHNWFYKNVSELSGGQKQLLNLASVMVMQPRVLVLDEPTSQLDPIAAAEFLKTVKKINNELGTTVILSEHRLDEAFPLSDRVIAMENGRVIAFDEPKKVGEMLKSTKNDMFLSLPAPMRIYSAVENNLTCPVTVKEGRKWLEEMSKTMEFEKAASDEYKNDENEIAVNFKDVWFRYDKSLPDVLKGTSVSIKKGEIFSIVGGNGAGKSTFLMLAGGVFKQYRGTVKCCGRTAVLPQNPQALFTAKTVMIDLYEAFDGAELDDRQKEERVNNVLDLCELQNLVNEHPYDLSGGEQQRAALAKVLLSNPEILLLDEPTKGMDGYFKEEFLKILKEIKSMGVTVIVVSHDIEFCAEASDRCAMFFDGQITSEGSAKRFFAGKSFYTTATNRMAREFLPDAVLVSDVVGAMGGRIIKNENKHKSHSVKSIKAPEPIVKKRDTRKKAGFVFVALFFAFAVLQFFLRKEAKLFEIAMLVSFVIGTYLLFGNSSAIEKEEKKTKQKRKKLSKQSIAAIIMALMAIPITVFFGVHFLHDRKYYFISLLVVLEAMLPFAIAFEGRKPKARELIIIAVMCALAVGGRTAFFMLPQFKPVLAIVIIAGASFGIETGFFVGAVTAFVSNMFIGQGSYTPWQMLALGMVGLLSGLVFHNNRVGKSKESFCVFGFLSALIYGAVMNFETMLSWQAGISKELFISAYAMGIYYDLVLGVATVIFMWLISVPMTEKLDRVKIKYGLVE